MEKEMNHSFYYMAGRCLGLNFGDEPNEFRNEIVSKFKKWVDYKLGDKLPSTQTEVNALVRQFLYDLKKGESRGRNRY